MLVSRALHSSICASCRLRASIIAKQFARSRKEQPLLGRGYVQRQALRFRGTATTAADKDEEDLNLDPGEHGALISKEQDGIDRIEQSPESAALHARQKFGDRLPEGELNEEEYRAYERLYGPPVTRNEDALGDGLEEQAVNIIEELDAGNGTGIMKESEDGILEEVEFEDGAEEVDMEGMDTIESWQPQQDEPFEAENVDEDDIQRIHPLTLANRSGTNPSTLQLPNSTLIEPIESQLSTISNVHLKQAAHQVFGGVGLPYSTSTPRKGRTMQQKPIALDAYQGRMSERDGVVFLAALYPGIYASVMSVLVETRKRLGSRWAKKLVEKAGKNDLRILDAGGGGAGILAVRELLRAEWERMHEESSSASLDSPMALAEADGKLGGATVSPPLGHATVLTGSDVLRQCVSRLLENTTFVPRLPDYVHTEDAKKKGKFDIVIAPHTLWGLREDYDRKAHVENLWDLASADGGVLILMEKGVARGFELVASAREMLLDTRIEPANTTDHEMAGSPLAEVYHKEKGMIIAPCTNHATVCPMYQPKGMMKGRRDICHFSQRYIRPSFLQNILGARDKNWEDVKFSYISVMRSRDLREERGADIVKGDEATEMAFVGYENVDGKTPGALELPRSILPPLKRKGHVILDFCTPSGTLERWTVPRSFSKVAFRDARKSSWGDLWALGAKTRVPRTPKIKSRNNAADMDAKLVKRQSRKGYGLDADEYGRIVVADEDQLADIEEEVDAEHGPKYAAKPRGRGRRISGIRDKRDKKGDGNGRRKNAVDD